MASTNCFDLKKEQVALAADNDKRVNVVPHRVMRSLGEWIVIPRNESSDAHPYPRYHVQPDSTMCSGSLALLLNVVHMQQLFVVVNTAMHISVSNCPRESKVELRRQAKRVNRQSSANDELLTAGHKTLSREPSKTDIVYSPL